MKLTDLACKAAKPKDKPYKLTDGAGLYLMLTPSGGKLWRQKYTHHGKEKTFSIGAYPIITLAEARDERQRIKKLLAQGQDPMELKRDMRRQASRSAQNTFKAVALEWHEVQKYKWSLSHANNVLRKLEQDIFPTLGNMPISKIKAPDLLDALRKIERRDALDVVGRTRQICGQVFRYGIQLGRCENNPAEQLRGALKTRKTQHFAAIDAKELPEFISTIRQNDARLYARTRNAIMLSLLTFVRPGELRQAKWSEIDFEARLWHIPAERMKMRKDHFVPLSRQAIAILREQQQDTARLKTDWVFPSQKRPSQPMSDGTVLVAIKRSGYNGRMTAHGFRALARTVIREKLNYAPDIIEMQLAHKPAGPLGAAYDRAQFLEQRTIMMQDWSDYIDTVSNGGSVTHINFKKQA